MAKQRHPHKMDPHLLEYILIGKIKKSFCMQQEVSGTIFFAREEESLGFIMPVIDTVNSRIAEFGYYFNLLQEKYWNMEKALGFGSSYRK